MKSLNDIEIFGTLGRPPVLSGIKEMGGAKQIRVVFPIVWQPKGGEAQYITATAIADTARNLRAYVLAGEPTQFTGVLSRNKHTGETRMQVSSVERYVTDLPTVEVQGLKQPLKALLGGESFVTLRGHCPEESNIIPDSELYEFIIKNEVQRLERSIEQRLLVRGPYPTREGQAVSVRGEWVQPVRFDLTDLDLTDAQLESGSPQKEGTGYVLARVMRVGERTTAPANLTNRSPEQRLLMETPA